MSEVDAGLKTWKASRGAVLCELALGARASLEPAHSKHSSPLRAPIASAHHALRASQPIHLRNVALGHMMATSDGLFSICVCGTCMSDLGAVLTHIESNLDAATNDCLRFCAHVRFPTDPAYTQECRGCTDWHVQDLMTRDRS